MRIQCSHCGQKHEETPAENASRKLKEWAEEQALCCGGAWTQEMVLDLMKENAYFLAPILAQIANYNNQG